jgi:serine/threonine-protein kinase
MMHAADALGAAHRAGIVHRDIKPENVMVRDDGRVIVLDFGIARLSKAGLERVRTDKGVLLGTLAYMAPEQVDAKPVDGRADQFAWGVTTFEMLTGRLPWPPARNAMQILNAIMGHKPEPLEPIVAGLPAGVAAVVARTLRKDPSERFESMEALLAELGRYVEWHSNASRAEQAPAKSTSVPPPTHRAVALAPTVPLDRAEAASAVTEEVKGVSPLATTAKASESEPTATPEITVRPRASSKLTWVVVAVVCVIAAAVALALSR